MAMPGFRPRSSDSKVYIFAVAPERVPGQVSLLDPHWIFGSEVNVLPGGHAHLFEECASGKC